MSFTAFPVPPVLCFHTIKFFWNSILPAQILRCISVSTLLSPSETVPGFLAQAIGISGFHTIKFFWNFGYDSSHETNYVSFHTIKFFWNHYLTCYIPASQNVSTLLSSSETQGSFCLSIPRRQVSTLLSSSETCSSLMMVMKFISCFHTIKFFWNNLPLMHYSWIYRMVSTLLSSSETVPFAHELQTAPEFPHY